jgi:hypothetical protein
LAQQAMESVIGTGHNLPGTAIFLSAQVPVSGGEAIEILKDGKPIARRERGAYALVVRDVDVRQDEAHRVCGASGYAAQPGCGGASDEGLVTLVTWHTHYGGASPLKAKVDFSGDGGATWRPVFFGPDRGRVMLNNGILAPAQTARMRVRVSDGFNEAVAISPVFRELESKPVLRIYSPAAGAELRTGQMIYLSGRAYDAMHQLVPGERMIWYAGDQMLGTGQTLIVPSLPLGETSIRLVVMDEQGRPVERETKLRVTAR